MTQDWLTYRARHTGRTKHELLRDAPRGRR